MITRPRLGRPSNAIAEVLTERVLDAAALLFLEQGYAATSLEAIAAKASVGKHTLYRRFPDKSILFAAVIKRASDGIEAVAAPRTDLTILENLRALMTASLETLTRPYALQFLRMVIAEGTRFPELSESYNRTATDTLLNAAEGLIRQAQAAGELGYGEPAWLARICVGMTAGVVFQTCLTGTDIFSTAEARAEHLERSWRVFLHGACQLEPGE